MSNPLYYRTLTIDHTKVPSNQTNFPVLVSITYTDLKSVGNGGVVQSSSGYDIQFYQDSNLSIKLNWEVEKYDATTGELIAHVNVPSISSSVDTVFYMGYDDSSISSFQGNATSVWDSDFLSVYHYPDGTTLGLNDSTSNANNLTNHSATADTGQIDGGVAFDGSTQWLSAGSGVDTGISSEFTIEMWARPALLGVAKSLVRNDGGSGARGYYSGLNTSSQFRGGRLGSGGAVVDGGTTLSVNTWYYFTVRYVSSVLKIYVNGTEDGSAAISSGYISTFSRLAIGAYDPDNGGEWFNGKLDEVRISRIARSVDWITATYNSYNSPSTFITVGTNQNFVPANSVFASPILQAVQRAATF